jgi:hypothetical protein
MNIEPPTLRDTDVEDRIARAHSLEELKSAVSRRLPNSSCEEFDHEVDRRWHVGISKLSRLEAHMDTVAGASFTLGNWSLIALM